MLASANRAQAGPAEDTRTAANSSLISGFVPAVSTAREAATANAVAPTTFGDEPAVAGGS